MYDPWQFTMTNVQQSMDYYLTGGDAESRHYHLEVKPAPTIVSISHDLDFPDYTKIEDRKDIEGGEVEAIEGTEVTVHAQTNMPASSATINFASPEITPAPMDAAEGRSDPVDRQVQGQQVGDVSHRFPDGQQPGQSQPGELRHHRDPRSAPDRAVRPARQAARQGPGQRQGRPR